MNNISANAVSIPIQYKIGMIKINGQPDQLKLFFFLQGQRKLDAA